MDRFCEGGCGISTLYLQAVIPSPVRIPIPGTVAKQSGCFPQHDKQPKRLQAGTWLAPGSLPKGQPRVWRLRLGHLA
jgi:hypothetical protein